MHKENIIFDKVKKIIRDYNLIKPHEKIIVGLSGGPDSIFLLLFLKSISQELNLDIIAAYLDHQWRENSYLDIELCQNLCKSLEIKFIKKNAQEIILEKKYSGGSKEEHGRLLRRQFFANLVKEYNADSVALGHHKDDQLETFFIRLIRGSTISGLSGIKPRSGIYIRPLLSIAKLEILNYLDLNKINYIKDYTNLEDAYLRNRIRKYVIPNLEKVDTRFKKNLEETINSINNTDEFLEKLTNQTFENIIMKQGLPHNINNIILDKKKFLEIDDYLKPRILIYWFIKEQVPFEPSQKLFKEIVRFLNQNKSNKHAIYPTWSICKKQNNIFIEKKQNNIFIEKK